MSKSTENNQEELRKEELRSKANLLGVAYSQNIGNDTLEERIKEHMEAKTASELYQQEAAVAFKSADKAKLDMAKIPLKVRVSNLDVEEREHTTVYRCVLNEKMVLAHVIPLDKPWFVPKCLVDSLNDSMMQVHVKELDPLTGRPTGNSAPKQVKKYNIQDIS